MKLFDVISPDGFSTTMATLYKSEESAKEGLKKWMKGYERQGYYSSMQGRIPLSELESHCKIVPTEIDDEDLENFTIE